MILPQAPRVEVLSRTDMATITKVRMVCLRNIVLNVDLGSHLKLQGSKRKRPCTDYCV